MQSEDFMTADWYVCLQRYMHLALANMKQFVISRFAFPSEVLRKISSRITNEVAGINRVTYDISSKPPAVCFFSLTNVYIYMIDSSVFFFFLK